ncbi:MAG: hypothetical protein ACOX27_04365 [Caldicoprobacterales bacterium]
MRQNANLKAITSNLVNIQKAAEMVAAEKNMPITNVNDEDGNGDVFNALGNWPKGPGSVKYSVSGGEAIATLGENKPPLPEEYKDATKISYTEVASQ